MHNDCLLVCGFLNTFKGSPTMSRFSLNLNIGDAATATVCFDLESDVDDYGIDWDTLEVWYKGVDITDTMDINDLQSIDKQVKQSWDEVENQIKENWHD